MTDPRWTYLYIALVYSGIGFWVGWAVGRARGYHQAAERFRFPKLDITINKKDEPNHE